jgi:hypothetical protein
MRGSIVGAAKAEEYWSKKGRALLLQNLIHSHLVLDKTTHFFNPQSLLVDPAKSMAYSVYLNSCTVFVSRAFITLTLFTLYMEVPVTVVV